MRPVALPNICSSTSEALKASAIPSSGFCKIQKQQPINLLLERDALRRLKCKIVLKTATKFEISAHRTEFILREKPYAD